MRSPSSPPVPSVVVFALGVAMFLAVYLPVAGRGFIGDDFDWALRNRVRSPGDIVAILTRDNGFYRPVVALSFAASELAAGRAPRPYGLINVALALGSAAGIAFLARSAGLSSGAGWFAGLLWLLNVHGINMAVLWLSGRTALLVTMAATLSAGYLLRQRPWLASMWLGIALFTKEEALALPAIGAAWLLLLCPSRARRTPLIWGLGSVALVAFYLWARSTTDAMTPATAPPYYRLTFEAALLTRNIVEYADRTLTFFATVAAILFMSLGRPLPSLDVSARTRALIAACAVWMAGAFAITIFVPVRSSLYVCLPAVGAAIAAAALIDGWWVRAGEAGRRRATVAAFVVVLVLYPILASRTDRWVETAEFSTVALRDIQALTADLPEGALVVLHDDRSRRANLQSAFGGMLDQAHLFATGRQMRFRIEPSFMAERQAPDRAAVEAFVCGGRVVRDACYPTR